MSDTPKQLSNARVTILNLNGTEALAVASVNSTGGVAQLGGGSTQVSVAGLLTSSGASMVDSTNNALNVTIRAGSAAGTEYTDGDVDASVSGGALLFSNSSNTLRPVNSTRGLPVNVVAGNVAITGSVTTLPSFSDAAAQTVGALNETALSSNGIVSFHIPSGLTGTISFERSPDGLGNWVAEGAWLSDGTYATSVSSFPATGTLQTYGIHRLRVSAYTSGSADIYVSYFLQPLSVGSYVRGTVTAQQGVGNSSGADAWPTATVDSSNAIVKPGDGANNAIRVNVVAGAAAGSTIVSVSTGSVRVHQSTATDLLARVNQGVGNSSAADRWRVLTANSSAADYNAVRLVDSSGTGYHGPSNPLPTAITDSSNAVVKPGDSANNAVRVNVIASAAGGTEYTEGDVDSTPNGLAVFFSNSSNTMRVVSSTLGLPVNVIGGSISASTQVSLGSAIPAGANLIGQVSIATPLSSAVANSASSAVLVRVVGGVSSAVDFQARVNQGIGNSSAADRWRVLAANSSAADFIATRLVDSSGTGFYGPTNPLSIQHRTSSGALMDDSTNNALRVNVVAGAAGGSTVISVSQLLDSSGGTITAGDNVNQAIRVNVVAGAAGGSTIMTVSTGSVRVHQSTASDLLVTIYPQSSVAPSSGSSGVVVRQVIDAIQSTGSTSFFGGGGNSTIFTLQSSAANLRSYVTAYSFTSTNQTPFTIGFYSSGNLIAPIRLAAVSSAVTGVNLAVGPPGYLFRTEASAALSIRIDQSSRTGDVGWVSWYVAP